MSEKRRDNRNRILQTGESQRKDGRYAYKYVDNSGKQKFVYAWKLVPTDKTPTGKRDDLSLREKEKEIQKDLDDGIDTKGKKMTVCELYAKHIRQNGNVKKSTKRGRNYLMSLIEADEIGNAPIERIRMSEAKEWVLRMKERDFSFKSIRNYKRALSAAFYSAIQNDYIRKNPFDFDIADVIENDSTPKEALTQEQEDAFLAFIKSDNIYKKYYDEMLILLGTGLRISELCGLTDNDLDLQNRIINVDHQLLYFPDTGYYISTPKTKMGNRQIPMNNTVYEAFMRVLQRSAKCTVEIDGYTNFLFCKKNGIPRMGVDYSGTFQKLRKKYNNNCEVALPSVTTLHTMRHTFCTKMANAGMNPKALQYIMGHSNITMTLNYYAHATFASAKDEMMRLFT